MNIYDIAREAGVSISTVSRVLNAKDNVNASTRQRVQDVLDRNHYTPSAIARGMISKSMRSIAVMTNDVRVYTYANTAYVVEQEFSKKGYNVTVCSTGGSVEAGIRYLRILTEKQFDGIIIIGSVFNALNQSEEVRHLLHDTPTVLANGRLALPNSYSVLMDDNMGIRMAVEHLVEKGHRDIWYCKEMTTDSANRKEQGFLQAMEQCGIADAQRRVLHTEFSIRGGLEAAGRLLESGEKVSAVVCGEDVTACGVTKGILRAGLRVPQDIAVTGYNNSDVAHSCEPELTSVDNKAGIVGVLCAQMLEKLINGGEECYSMTIQPQLVEGGST